VPDANEASTGSIAPSMERSSRAIDRIRRLEQLEHERIELEAHRDARRAGIVDAAKPSGGRHDTVDRIEDLTKFPLAVLGVVWLVVAIVVVTSAAHGTSPVFFVASLFALWLIFLVEYVVRLFVTPDTHGYLKRRWAEPATVLIPVLQGWHVLGIERICIALREGELRVEGILKHHSLARVMLAAVGTIFIGAWLILLFEQHVPGHNIRDYPDALWWAIVTVTTVGYGDKFPYSEGGRIVATFLMLVGIGLIGVLTATVASVFVKEHTDANRDQLQRSHADLSSQVTVISDRLADIERRLGATPEQIAAIDAQASAERAAEEAPPGTPGS
jgi:voltage-gated potassium channel